MRIRSLLISFALAALPTVAFAQPPVTVMVLGVFHMSNPDRDMHNLQVDDVLQPKRQAELTAVIDGLKKFRPTVVDIEWPADVVTTRYDQYAKGTLAPSRNESVQLGFRLAKESGAQIHGIDSDGDFPYDAVNAYAKAHGQNDALAAADASIVGMIKVEQDTIDKGTISQALRGMNGPDFARDNNVFYDDMLRVGAGDNQPGADLLAAWYKRNQHICANIVQLSKPGDRVVVIFGSGHEFLLRRCVTDMPGFVLAEPNDYLP